MGALVNQRDVRQDSGKAPYMPEAGASSALSSNKQIQASLLFLEDAIPLRATDSDSKNSLSGRACSKDPLGARGALAGS